MSQPNSVNPLGIRSSVPQALRLLLADSSNLQGPWPTIAQRPSVVFARQLVQQLPDAAPTDAAVSALLGLLSALGMPGGVATLSLVEAIRLAEQQLDAAP